MIPTPDIEWFFHLVEKKLHTTELYPLIGKAISWSQIVGLDAKPLGTLRKRGWTGVGKIGYESQV